MKTFEVYLRDYSKPVAVYGEKTGTINGELYVFDAEDGIVALFAHNTWDFVKEKV